MLKQLSSRIRRPASASPKKSEREKEKENVPEKESQQAAYRPHENLLGKLKPPEHLLNLLSSQVSAFYFSQYVSKKFSSETLSFWVAVEHFKCRVSQNESVAVPYAKEIFDTYLKRFSEKEVNLEGEQHNLNISTVSVRTFDSLQDKAWQLLVNSDYQKFTTSQDYKDYIGMCLIDFCYYLHSLRRWQAFDTT